MGGRDESSLELGGRQVHPLVEHPMEKLLEPISIRTLSRFPAGYRLTGEKESEHRPDPVYCNAWRRLGCKLGRPELGNLIDLGMRLQVAQHRDTGADRQGIARKRSGLID